MTEYKATESLEQHTKQTALWKHSSFKNLKILENWIKLEPPAYFLFQPIVWMSKRGWLPFPKK